MSLRLALFAVLLLAACTGRSNDLPAGAEGSEANGDGAGGAAGGRGDGAGRAGAGAGRGRRTPPHELPGNRAAEPEGPTGEVVHATDRKTTQGFGRTDLAVGGGFVYWIERPRLEPDATSVVKRKPTGAAAGEAELVAGPGRLHAIAADAERLYVAGEALAAQPHAGGPAVELAAGAWLEVVPGQHHLLARSRDRVALIGKRPGGPIDTVWEGKHGKLSVDVEGDRFFAIPGSPWAQRTPLRAITVYAPGERPAVIAELAEARGGLALDGDWIYFSGDAGPATQAAPLWRIRRAGGAPARVERVGDPAWGFGELVIRRGTLYGMVFTGAWQLQKLPLAPGGAPSVLEGRVPSMIQALAADERHLYYLTDFDVRRAPL